ncbi:MAG: SEC-C domain-containing protein [Bryobacterales bacterium]|nr:SEC-C domain-containing protein [Bryobacterales bacterium]
MQIFTPRQADVLEALASGLSVTAAADAAGVHRTTVHHWCRTIPDFRFALEALKQARIDTIRDGMNELVAPSLAILKNVVLDESASPALRIRTALAVIKFVSTPGKPVTNTQELDMMVHAYTAGLKQSTPAETPNPEIHRNSSPSSQTPQTDESPAAAPDAPLQTPRNALCPCGSKLKFKRCCGKNAPPVLGQAA